MWTATLSRPNAKAWSRLIVTLGIVLFFVVLLAYGFTRDARYIQSPLIGRQAVDFTLTGPILQSTRHDTTSVRSSRAMSLPLKSPSATAVRKN
jgi:hypothetical protein